jgi:hypothetical protein
MLLTYSATAEIYKWVDKNGNVHYSDSEVDGSEQVKLTKGNTFTPVETTTAQPSAQEKIEVPTYTAISITNPSLNETIRDNNGNVAVIIDLAPALRSGNSITLFMDDKELLKGKTQTGFTLNNVDRGSHTLRASVVDKNGEVLISSKSVIFHLHRAIIRKKDSTPQNSNAPAEQDSKRNYNLDKTDTSGTTQ